MMRKLVLHLMVVCLTIAPCAAQELIWEQTTPVSASSLCFSADGTRLAIRAGDEIRLLDPQTGEVWAERLIPAECTERNEANIIFSADGRVLIATVQHDIFLLDGETLEILDQLEAEWPQCLDVSVSGRFVFGDRGVIKSRQLDGGAVAVARSDSVSDYGAFAFSPDGHLLAAAGFIRDSAVELWDADSWTMLGRLTGNPTYVNTLAFSPDGKVLVSGGGGREVFAWDVAVRKPRWRVTSDECCVGQTLAVDGVGRLVATAVQPGKVLLLDLRTGEKRASWEAHDQRGVMDVRFDPTGPRLASSGYDGTIKLWDLSELDGE